jgi:hypothetical protein
MRRLLASDTLMVFTRQESMGTKQLDVIVWAQEADSFADYQIRTGVENAA